MTHRPGRAVIAVATIAIALLLALGVWQIERRAGKLALIDRLERRLAAPPVAAPQDAGDEYLKVRATGRYLLCRTRYTQAVTGDGPGHWAMTPLLTDRATILVNRGFVPEGVTLSEPCAPVPATVTGLLRRSEPGGGFLRSNDPAANRWYSRDVAALGAGLPRLAPYFIDASAGGPGWPRGGLTVVRFRNHHLVYALTWFALAALVAVMTWRAGREGER